ETSQAMLEQAIREGEEQAEMIREELVSGREKLEHRLTEELDRLALEWQQEREQLTGKLAQVRRDNNEAQAALSEQQQEVERLAMEAAEREESQRTTVDILERDLLEREIGYEELQRQFAELQQQD
ncbi:hypothetical protein K0U00_49400, partial [Paenibacillus sepulcri]|nr:hypothetical protein [Paenibacillus sepulcri]